MDHKKQQSSGSSSSSSFTENLFGPKDAPSASSSGLFSSVFGPSSTGLGRHPSHSNNAGLSKNQEFGGPYGSGKPSTQDYKAQRSTGPDYRNETAEPSYLSSSIYYGGQEVYSPNTQTTRPPHTVSISALLLHMEAKSVKKDGGDTDPNGSSASRGNWWQGKNFMRLLVIKMKTDFVRDRSEFSYTFPTQTNLSSFCHKTKTLFNTSEFRRKCVAIFVRRKCVGNFGRNNSSILVVAKN
ncbi:hypothetical protein Hdeb2414_s0045g00744591 [Helianthus debilis subsp. tardiflorus]